MKDGLVSLFGGVLLHIVSLFFLKFIYSFLISIIVPWKLIHLGQHLRVCGLLLPNASWYKRSFLIIISLNNLYPVFGPSYYGFDKHSCHAFGLILPQRKRRSLLQTKELVAFRCSYWNRGSSISNYFRNQLPHFHADVRGMLRVLQRTHVHDTSQNLLGLLPWEERNGVWNYNLRLRTGFFHFLFP